MKYANKFLEYIVNFALDILFPKMCIGCGKYESDICLECISKIEKVRTPTCFYCGKICKNGSICPNCRQKTQTKISSIITAAIYDSGPTKEIIHYFKYSGYSAFSNVLGELIVERIKEQNIINKSIIVVPVPMHKKRELERGYNHAELLARYVSRELKLHGGMALEKIRNNPQQMKLSRQKRLKNMKGTVICIDRELVINKEILLIDDVSTSGATLGECAQVLKDAGAGKIWGAVVARG